MNNILRAAQFARQAHADQRRKYNDLPYIIHPARVAGRIAIHPRATESMVVAAFLHDVVEDTLHTRDDIQAEFGPDVAQLVGELTNPSKDSTASRPERKQQDREHLAGVSWEAKIIKLVDRIDNLREVQEAPSGFQRLYCAESRLLAGLLGDADSDLKAELLRCVDNLESE